MTQNHRFGLAIFLTLVCCVIMSAAALADGNSFITGDLRVDLPEVYNANNYRVYLNAHSLPSTGDIRNFATAWLGVYLGKYDGSFGSGQFSQVGLRATRNGIQWFVYAEPGVDCYRGSHPDAGRCYGDYNDLVSVGTWHQVMLYKGESTGYWFARVYNESGNYVTVARINSQSNRIYLARSETEEGYHEINDTLPFNFITGVRSTCNPGDGSIGRKVIISAKVKY